jgi:hypothetical protein
VETAFQGGRPGTSRPVTSSGRFVRLGTASMLSEASGPFINVDKLDLAKYAKRPMLARVLCDYILYHDHNPKKALELCAYSTQKVRGLRGSLAVWTSPLPLTHFTIFFDSPFSSWSLLSFNLLSFPFCHNLLMTHCVGKSLRNEVGCSYWM